VTGKLTTLPRPPSRIWRPLLDGEGTERIREGKEGEERAAADAEETGMNPGSLGWDCWATCKKCTDRAKITFNVKS